MELPLLPLLARMEASGLQVSSTLLSDSKPLIESQLRQVEEAAAKSVGHSFLLSSPKRVCEVLYDELKLVPPAGLPRRSSTERVLQALQNAHPLPSLLIEHRRLSKLLKSLSPLRCIVAPTWTVCRRRWFRRPSVRAISSSRRGTSWPPAPGVSRRPRPTCRVFRRQASVAAAT